MPSRELTGGGVAKGRAPTSAWASCAAPHPQLGSPHRRRPAEPTYLLFLGHPQTPLIVLPSQSPEWGGTHCKCIPGDEGVPLSNGSTTSYEPPRRRHSPNWPSSFTNNSTMLQAMAVGAGISSTTLLSLMTFPSSLADT